MDSSSFHNEPRKMGSEYGELAAAIPSGKKAPAAGIAFFYFYFLKELLFGSSSGVPFNQGLCLVQAPF